MRLSNIQSFSAQNTQAFGARRRQRQENVTRVYNETLQSMDNTSMYTAPDNVTRKRIAAALTALALFSAGGAGGYKLGKDMSDEEVYLAGYQAGMEQILNEMKEAEDKVLAEATSTPFINTVEVTPTPAPIQTQEFGSEIPAKVQSLAVDTLKEFDLTQKPYLFEDKSELPVYFPEYGIDRAVLAKAQNNFARVFKSGNYIIISPKYDTTMGEIKKVMGVADEVIGKDEANELKTREQIAGSNGNLDNAIVEAGDAIRIKYYDSERGHVVGSYAIHKSDSSRRKIAEAIVEWSQK